MYIIYIIISDTMGDVHRLTGNRFKAKHPVAPQSPLVTMAMPRHSWQRGRRTAFPDRLPF